MSAQDPQPGEYNVTERLFSFIDELSPDMQFALYQQLVEDRVGVQLFKLIIDMSDEEKIQFLEQLDEMAVETEPVKTINLDENESFMRENPRKNCLVAAKCKVGDVSFSSYICNISVHGVFIEGVERFRPGQIIWMAFKLPDTSQPLKVKGKINRGGQRGIGVSFLNLNRDQQDIIRAFIAANHLS